jgi:hypothetical protein
MQDQVLKEVKFKQQLDHKALDLFTKKQSLHVAKQLKHQVAQQRENKHLLELLRLLQMMAVKEKQRQLRAIVHLKGEAEDKPAI